jgi:hypothetical protein
MIVANVDLDETVRHAIDPFPPRYDQRQFTGMGAPDHVSGQFRTPDAMGIDEEYLVVR